MRPLAAFLTVSALLVAGGCAATSGGAPPAEGRAIAAIDAAPWYSGASSAGLGPVGPGDLRPAHWWQADPVWEPFLLPGVRGKASVPPSRGSGG